VKPTVVIANTTQGLKEGLDEVVLTALLVIARTGNHHRGLSETQAGRGEGDLVPSHLEEI
jgi:hypothetical protein